MGKKAMVSDAELEILEVLWSADCALNANEIRSTLDKVKHWERTTVLTLIQRLLKKGVICQEKREVYYYTPCIKRVDYVKEETKNFIAASLVSSEALTKADIEELRDYFNQHL